MLISSLTVKGQAIIPAKICQTLYLETGDKINFKVQDNIVVISKAQPMGYLYHAALSGLLGEWDSKEDEVAYRDW